jgi:hypothetical protein
MMGSGVRVPESALSSLSSDFLALPVVGAPLHAARELVGAASG